MLRNFKTFAIAALLLIALPSYADEEEALYKQESVLIYKFLSYFTWPQAVYSGDMKNISICIIGKDKLDGTLDQLAAAASRDKLKINIKRDVAAEAAASCNVAYIADSQKTDVDQVLAAIGKSPVVTISDIEGFAGKGGTLGFVVKRGKLKFEINKGAATKQSIKISADLLELAVNVIE